MEKHTLITIDPELLQVPGFLEVIEGRINNINKLNPAPVFEIKVATISVIDPTNIWAIFNFGRQYSDTINLFKK